MAGRIPVTFGVLLRRLRTDAGLTQEELAEAAGISTRSVSDLERGVNLAPRKDTARLLADALNLTGPAREEFEGVAHRRLPVDGHAVAAGVRTLPRDVTSFTGRDLELRELANAVTSTAASGGGIRIHAISGMAGIGKTAFAVHAAHLLASQFPDGQIFVPLHAHTPGQLPVDPSDALASLLLTMGVVPQQIPAGLEARTSVWRNRLAGRRLLLVLDDAATSDQVRPLLPGTGESLVLITSRRHLSALEDATAVSLGTLPPGEAADLLVRLAARPALDPGNDAVNGIIRLCGYLPLAIGMLARQLHHHPSWSVADLAADLAAARDRLELMATENLSVAAAFNLSYQDLTQSQKRMFRLLGSHPGFDINAYAAAALGGLDLGTARRHLETLYDHCLLTEPARGRYRLHDLIREHARNLAIQEDQGAGQEQAISRVLDYYQHVARIADGRLSRHARSSPMIPLASVEIPVLHDTAEALSWLRAERANLQSCVEYCTSAGQLARVVGLTSAMAALLQRDGPWTDAIARHSAAARAARDSGDRLGEANALIDLGKLCYLTGDYPGAVDILTTALQTSRDLGDRQSEANALHSMAALRQRTGEYQTAKDALQDATAIYRDLGDRIGQASALTILGSVLRALGEYERATRAQEESLAISRDIGDQLGQANALWSLAATHYLTGDFKAAAAAINVALGIFRDVGDRQGEANALTYLGDVCLLVGEFPAALAALMRALDLYRELGDRAGQANALDIVGKIRLKTGDYPGAVRALEMALSISRDIGYRVGQANALEGLGGARRRAGDYPAATAALNEALGILRDIGNRGGEVTALNEIGALQRVSGDLGQAEATHQLALGLARQIASRWDEAQALAGLGRCARAAGRWVEASAALRQAQEIFQDIGAAEAAEVSAELSEYLQGTW